MPPSSITTTSSNRSGPVSLALVKISLCTTPNLHAKLRWIHLPNRDGMFAVFDTLRRREVHGSVSEKRVLKLICGSDLLDTLDFDALKYQARLDEELSRSQQLSVSDLRMMVIAKKPLLAVRYQLPDGQIRRLQMNFRPESGFDYAVDAISAAGLPIQDRGAVGGPAPQSSRPQSAQAAFPDSSHKCSHKHRGDSNSAHGYISPSSLLPKYSSPPAYSSPYGAAVSGINQDDFSRPLLPLTRAGYSGNGPVEMGSTNRPTAQWHLDSSSVAIQQDHFAMGYRHVPSHLADSSSRSTHVNSHGINPLRPTSAPETQSERLVPETVSLTQMLPPNRVLPFPEKKAKPRSRASDSTDSSQQPPESNANGSMKPKAKRSRASKEEKGPTIAKRSSDGKMVKLVCLDCRRSDFKNAGGFVNHCRQAHSKHFLTCDAAIEANGEEVDGERVGKDGQDYTPQAREVAKAKFPVNKNKQQDPLISVFPSRDTVGTHAKIYMTPDKAPAASTTIKKANTPKKRASPKRPISPFSDEVSDAVMKEVPVQVLKEVPSLVPTPGSDPVIPVATGSSKGIVHDNVLSSAQRRPAAISAQPAAAANPVLSNIQPAEFMSSLDSWIRTYHHLPAPQVPQTSKDILAKYAAQNDDDRARAIDDMICECLEDENFRKLVDDVEGAWMRIGLGF